MIFAALVGLSLLTNVAVENSTSAGAQAPIPSVGVSIPERSAIMRRLIRSANDCVVRTVSADPRFRPSLAPEEVNTLIVESMTACSQAMQAMIDAHDRMFGAGTGETFFMGPYLDVLPATVSSHIRDVEH